MAEVALEPEAPEDIEEYARGRALELRRPVPGESLTGDPEKPWPWEQPPQFTEQNDVLEYYFDLFTSEDVYERILDLMEDEVAIMDIVQIFLTKGFQEGLFNPDMMLIIAEPLAYMLISLAERAGIEFVITEDEEGAEPTTQLGSALSTIQEPQPTEEVDTMMGEEAPSLLAREQ